MKTGFQAIVLTTEPGKAIMIIVRETVTTGRGWVMFPMQFGKSAGITKLRE